MQYSLGLMLAMSAMAVRLQAQDHSPTDWLPATTAVHVQIEPAAKLLDHPARKTIQSSEVFRKLWRHPEVMKVRGGITVFEYALGVNTESLIRSLTAHGVHVAVDAKTRGVIVLAKTESEEWLKEYLVKLVDLARKDAASKKQPDPIKEAEYDGVHFYEAQKAIVSALGDWLVITNNGELAKSMLQRYRDKGNDSLSSVPAFRESRQVSSQVDESEQIAKLYVDLEVLRNAGMAKELLGNMPKDFGAELILGGILGALHHAPFATADLHLHNKGLVLQSKVPFRKEWISESREFYVGPNGGGVAPPLIQLPNAIASLSTYRDISQMWLRAGDLFDQNTNDKLAQADNTLTTLFSGKDFGEDILGAVHPELQLVVAPQTFAEKSLAPAIKLPAFALVGQLRSPETMQRELKRIFQSFIGFLNVVGAMEGQPQLDLLMDKDSETKIQYYWAEYIKDSDKKYDNGLPIQFNFSPCIAFHDQQVYLCSTVELARQISGVAPTTSSDKPVNTLGSFGFPALHRVLVENREQLISQNVLEKGHSRDEAEKEVDTLLSILTLFENAGVALSFGDYATLRLDLNMRSE